MADEIHVFAYYMDGMHTRGLTTFHRVKYYLSPYFKGSKSVAFHSTASDSNRIVYSSSSGNLAQAEKRNGDLEYIIEDMKTQHRKKTTHLHNQIDTLSKERESAKKPDESKIKELETAKGDGEKMTQELLETKGEIARQAQELATLFTKYSALGAAMQAVLKTDAKDQSVANVSAAVAFVFLTLHV